MEAEARLYWTALSTAWDLFKTKGILAPEIDDCREEIEVLEMHTEWPRMKTLCQRVIARDDEWRVKARAAATATAAAIVAAPTQALAALVA